VLLFQVGRIELVPLVEITGGFLSGSDLPLPLGLSQKWDGAVKSDADFPASSTSV